MADAAVARVRLALEGANVVEQGLGRLQGKVSDLGKSMLGLAGGLTAAGFAAWVKGAIDAADQTDELAQKTGLLVEQVAGLKLLFEKEGLGDEFGKTMAKLSKGASEGNKAFEAMGITVRNSTGHLKSTRELLAEVADKFAGYRDGAEKTALAMELFGKSGADLIPLLNNGAAGIDEMDQRARELGLTLSKEAAAAAAQFNDNLFILKQYASSASVSVANELLPSLVDLSSAFATATRYGGGLLGTLRLFGKTSYGTEGFNLSKDLAEAREKMDDLAAARQRYLRANSDTSGIDQAMVATARELEYLKDLQRQTVKTAATDQSMAEARRLGLKTLNEYAPALEKHAQTTSAAAKATRNHSDEEKRLAAALRERIAAAQSNNAAFDEEFERIEGVRLATEGRIKSAREMLESIERETAMLGLSNEERQRAIALFELERDGVVKGTEAYAAYADKISQAIGNQTARQAALDAQKKLADEQTKAIEEQQRAYQDMWRSVDDTAHDVFVSVANEGEDAFKRIGKTLKAAVLDLLYQMTVKKWIIQISGQGGAGGFGGGGGTNLLMSAAQSYMSGGSALGASASAVGSYVSGNMSLANTYGSIYANATGTGMNGLLATNGAYGTASTAGTAGAASSGASAMTVAGYAALIYAAVKYAESLYAKGYNRDLLGQGQSQSYTFGRGNRTSGMTDNAGYRYSTENVNRRVFDAIGMSEKWADILSGTTRYAHMFARKLSGYGYAIGLEGGGGVSVGGYETYRPGWAGRLLGRGTKTNAVDLDQRDVQAVTMAVQSVREGAKGMAAAMGLSAEAIDNYTGRLKVNMKGANTAAEQAERMQKAMDNLQYSLIKAASGGKMARAEFNRLMEQVKANMEEVGISTAGIADIIAQGMMGKMSQAQVGEALGEMVIGGIYNAVVSPFAGSIAQAFMAQIITPMMTAVTTGGSVANAVSQASIASVVASANAAAQQLSAILADPAFRAAISGIQQAITGISAASVRPAANVKRFGSSMKSAGSAASSAAEEIKRAWSSVVDSLIDEVRRLRGEIVGSGDQALSYTVAQFASATAAARAGDRNAAEQLTTISRSVEEAALRDAASRGDLNAIRGWLIESQMQTAALIGSRYRLPVPAFDVGTNYVPRDMLALIHEGEAVVPKAYNPAAGANDAMLAEMRAMTAEAKRAADSNAAVALKLDEIAKGRWTLRTVAA